MQLKKHLKPFIKVMLLARKNTGIIRYIPFFTINIFLPLFFVFQYFNAISIEQMQFRMRAIGQFFLPLFSVWNTIFSLKDFIEGDLSEVLCITDNNIVLKVALSSFLIVLFNVTLFLIIVTGFLPSLAYEVLRIISASFFLFCCVYFISILFRSTSISLLAVILYLSLNYMLKSAQPKLVIFMSNAEIRWDNYSTTFTLLLFLSISFFALGNIVERKKLVM